MSARKVAASKLKSVVEVGAKAELAYKDATSDKVYNVLLERAPGGWITRASYGRRGKTLTNMIKTPGVVTWAEARVMFDDLVTEKRRKGYKGNVSTATDDGSAQKEYEEQRKALSWLTKGKD